MLTRKGENASLSTWQNGTAFELIAAPRNLSTTLRQCRLRFTEQSLLFWMSRVG